MAQKKKRTKTKSKKKHAKKKINTKAFIIAVSVCLALALAVSLGISFTTGKKSPQQLYEFSQEVANGIDVSEHNGEIDWQSLKGEIDFAFIRVGYRGYLSGEINEDLYAKENISACEKAGIPYGVYFYSQATNEKEAVEEANFVIRMVKGHKPSLPLIIDYEYAADEYGELTGRLYDASLERDDAAKLINAFCDRAEEKGYSFGVYASSSVFANKINTKKLNDNALIWVADYNGRVTHNVNYTVWQYSKTGELDAVSSKYVDMNYWYNKVQ